MKKTVKKLVFLILTIGILCVPVLAIGEGPTPSALVVDGAKMSFDAYNIDGSNYFRLCDIAYALNGTAKQFEAVWDGAANTFFLTSGKPHAAVGADMAGKGGGVDTPGPANPKVLLDGTEVQIAACLLDGNYYFKLRDVGKAVDFGVEWDSARDTVIVDTASAYRFTLGHESRGSQPETVDEFIPIFAQQYRRYNDVALEIWPGNTLHDVPYIIEDVDTNRLWLIGPDGRVSALSEEEAKGMGLVQRHTLGFAMGAFGDFYTYNDKGDIVSQYFTADKFKGMYFTVNQESMDNIERWGKWPHVSGFDVLRFSIHESFHTFEQSKWQWQPVEERANYTTKDQFFEATDARIKRDLIIKQLQAAVNSMGDKKLVLDVLATYVDYKENLNDDYINALYWDRAEGTAQYFEFVASIYSYFPDQIKSKEDAYRALAQLGALDFYRLLVCGVIDEAYMTGAFTGILLDMLGIDWKTQFMNDPMLTPMEILYQNFKDETLPEPKQATQSEIDEVHKKMRDRKDGIIASLQESIAGYEERLKTASEEDKTRLSNMIEYYKKRIEELSE